MEVAPGVHTIDGVVGPPVYLIEDEVLALVDTSLPFNAPKVLRYIRRLGRQPREVAYVLITHGHPDHTGSAPALRRCTGAHLLANPFDTRLDGREQPLVAYMGFMGRWPVSIPFLERVPADGFLEDGQVLPLLGGLQVLHTPGHTPGSVCFYSEDRGVLFAGDLVVADRKGVGRSMPFPGSDWEEYQRSLERVADLKFQVVCPGHGKPITSDGSDIVRAIAKKQARAPLYWRVGQRLKRALLGL